MADLSSIAILIVGTEFINLIFRMLKVSVNGESQRLVVREVTDLMYNPEQLQENMMMDCWVLVFALDNKQSFGEKLFVKFCGKYHNLRLHLLHPGLHE